MILAGNLYMTYSYIIVCYLVGPQGSIKLFNLDTLLYFGDFKGKFVLFHLTLTTLCRWWTSLIQGVIFAV